MIDILGYFLFIVVGLFFGLFGSGGSIIMLPILHYIFNIPLEYARIYSLFLIFLITFIGALQHSKKQDVDLKKLLFFIVPTLIFTVISSFLLVPIIPDYIDYLNVSKTSFLMMIFSIVIFFSGLSLLKAKAIIIKFNSRWILVLVGILIGLLTGLLGIGGGFIIVPALILFINMDIKQAASAALVIIMLNTLLAIPFSISVIDAFQLSVGDYILLGKETMNPFKLEFIALLLFFGIIGFTIGIKILNKINVNIVKKIFSITLLLLSLIIFFSELL